MLWWFLTGLHFVISVHIILLLQSATVKNATIKMPLPITFLHFDNFKWSLTDKNVESEVLHAFVHVTLDILICWASFVSV